MGSGKYLKHAQDKHGIENFTKEILFVFDTPDEMYAKEAELVNEEFIAENNTYNIKLGGHGGWDFVNSDYSNMVERNKRGRTEANKTLLNKYGVSHPSQLDHRRAAVSERNRIMHAQGEFTHMPSFLGMSHTDETKKKISQSLSVAQSGSKNSQYGTRWIHSMILKVSRKIKKEDPLPDGWIEGRKIKF